MDHLHHMSELHQVNHMVENRIDLNDELHAELKIRAVEEKKSLKDLLVEIIQKDQENYRVKKGKKL